MALCVCEYACGSGCVCGPPTHCPGVPCSEGEAPQSLSPSPDSEEESGMAGQKGEREDCPETSTNFSSFGEFSAPRRCKGVVGCLGASVYPICESGRAGWGCCTPPWGEAKQSSPLHVTVWRNLQAGHAVESQSGSVTIIPDYQRRDDKTVVKDTLRQTDPRAQIKCLTISRWNKTPFPPVGFPPCSVSFP